MELKDQRNLKNMFRHGVGVIADDDDYYARIFNEGIRLVCEIERTPNSVAIAKLLYAFEKYCEWNQQLFKETRLSLVKCVIKYGELLD